MPRRLIDISSPLKAGIKSDPSHALPKSAYLDHHQTAPAMAEYMGVSVDQLPGGEYAAIERVSISTHNGTHLDAPYHYFSTMNHALKPGGEASWRIDEVPLEWCFQPAVKLDFRHLPDGYVATPGDIEAELQRIGHALRPLEIVVVNTAAGAKYGQDDYVDSGCGIGKAATLWMLERGVRLVGTDGWSWDAPFSHTRRKVAETGDAGLIWEGHRAGREIGYSHLEKLHNLEQLPADGFEVVCFPVKIHRARLDASSGDPAGLKERRPTIDKGEENMREPKALISTAQLANALGQPGLRVYDCTTYLEPTPAGSEDPYIAVPGIRTFAEAHVPGADFLDLQGEFSDQTTRLRFMMPEVAQLEAAFGRHGIGRGSRVVLYSIGSMMWATRFWWMLRSLGFDDAAVLDGGFDKWKAEGRPVESGPAKGYARATFKAMPRPGLFVDKGAVASAIGDASTVVVNALGPQFHKGLEPSRYGRPGRIPGSVNVSAATLFDAKTKDFTSLGDAAAKFAAQGVTKDKNVIAYCGGGISATIDLFLLHQLGYDKLTLYDGSMGEWAKDHALPIETG